MDVRITSKDNGEKCLLLFFLYRKGKNFWEQDYSYRCSFEAAKAATGVVLKFCARSLKNMFERVHFQVKQHARSLLSKNSYTDLFQEFYPDIQYLLLKFQNSKNTYVSQITSQWLFLNQFIGELAIHRNHTDIIAIIVTNS